MNRARPITRLGRTGMVAALTAGLLLTGSGLALAERDRQDDHRETRRDQHRGERRNDRDRREVTVVRELPRGSRTVRIGHDDYYVHEQRYDRQHRDGFVLVRPPVGAVFATLPIGNVRVTIGGDVFFAGDDSYYRPTRSGYVVVAPPALPPAAAIVIVRAPLLNVRSGPGRGFPVLCQVAAGTALAVGGGTPGWHYVAVPGGASGWVMAQFTGVRAEG